MGPESRGSSPVRFPRDEETWKASGIRGLYPVGEGAGYAGGIVSAALDGLRAAKAIIRRYAPLDSRDRPLRPDQDISTWLTISSTPSTRDTIDLGKLLQLPIGHVAPQREHAAI